MLMNTILRTLKARGAVLLWCEILDCPLTHLHLYALLFESFKFIINLVSKY